MGDVLERLRRKIEESGLTLSEAAREIGVTEPTLRRHLSGSYVRSDSLAKYRLWLKGGARRRSEMLQLPLEELENATVATRAPRVDLYTGPRPEGAPVYRVVDLFSGCGGLSLGFELFDGGATFRTVLALDIEEAMVRAFNHNHPAPLGAAVPIARRVDLSEFLSEAEVLAFYLSHLADLEQNSSLRSSLDELPVMGLTEFRARIAHVDEKFTKALAALRATPAYRQVYGSLSSQVLGQTSVIGFHDALKLPMTRSSSAVDLGTVLWSGTGEASPQAAIRSRQFADLRSQIRRELETRWDHQVQALGEKRRGNGRGQLASSARRIAAFLSFLETEPMQRVRELWLDWREERDALRFFLFARSEVEDALRTLYEEHGKVSVVLGGPPCQGFSRIGRGKIRSLREDQVHAHYDAEAGDIRNRLLHKYVLFVSALRPAAFLSENVAHFRSEVKTPVGVFRATDVLAEAIQEISEGGVSYQVAHRIIDASRHLVPQTRERFFMVGIRSDVGGTVEADWCLALPTAPAVPLRAALEGLPEPSPGGSNSKAPPDPQPRRAAVPAQQDAGRSAIDQYRAWIEQAPPEPLRHRRQFADAHHARVARADDAAFFELLGPGKRWMDYRCDRSQTLAELRMVLGTLLELLRAGKTGRHPTLKQLQTIDTEVVQRLVDRLDGSLSLRLLLESIEPLPGELVHHLATDNYLAKQEGNHGDWLARLHPDRPCKTIVTHMGKDTYAYVHPWRPRTLSVREAARVQTFPDWFSFGELSLVNGFRVIGNAVPPLLSYQLASRIACVLWTQVVREAATTGTGGQVAVGQ